MLLALQHQISVLDLCTVLAAELCYADALLWSVFSSCIYLGLTTTEHVHNTFVLALSEVISCKFKENHCTCISYK